MSEELLNKATLHVSPIWTQSFLLLCLANLSNSIAFYSSMPVFPLLVSDVFGLGGLALGLVVSTYTISAIITRPPTGFALDRLGRKQVLYAGAALFSCMYFLYPHATSALGIGLIRFCHGALWGVTMSSMNTVVVDLLPASRRGEGIGYFGLTMIIGMALGPAFGTYIQEHYGFTTLFYLAGLITCTGFLTILFVRFPHIEPHKHPFSLTVLFEKTSLPVSATILFMTIPYGTMVNFTSTFARTIPGANVPLYFLALAIGTAISRFAAGRIFDRSGPSHIMKISYVCLFFALCVLALHPTALSLPLTGFVYGLGFGIAVPVCQAMINALVPPERRGAANATFMTSFDCGIFIGLLITSTLQESFGWSGAYLALSCSILASAAIFILSANRQYAAHPHTLSSTDTPPKESSKMA